VGGLIAVKVCKYWHVGEGHRGDGCLGGLRAGCEGDRFPAVAECLRWFESESVWVGLGSTEKMAHGQEGFLSFFLDRGESASCDAISQGAPASSRQGTKKWQDICGTGKVGFANDGAWRAKALKARRWMEVDRGCSSVRWD
jgi:hypothetical protein